MSNNSGFAATMYESDPIVAALNKVPGFDPLKLMSWRRNPGAEKDERYLDFRYKKLWFRLAHKTGRICVNRLSITEQFAIIEAQVYLELVDANPVSSFTATCTREEGGDKYIESAQIKAMDQALTDAGFGLQFVPAPAGSTENTAAQATAQQPITQQQTIVQQAAVSARSAQTTQAQTAQDGQKAVTRPARTQAGMQKAATVPASQPADQLPVSAETLPADQLPVAEDGQTLPVTSDMAAAMSMLSGKVEPDALPVAPEGTKAGEKAETMPEELPVAPASVVPDTAAAAETAPVAYAAGQTAGADKPYTETTPVDQILQFMTLEDAKKVIVPTGTCRGWTLDEVAQRRRPSLRFYLSEGYQGKDNILRAAARLVLDDLEKKAG